MIQLFRQLQPRIEAGRRGQAIIEFVLIVPLLMVFLFGIIEMGHAWNTHHVVTNAAREGARVAALPGMGADTVRATIEERLQAGGLDPNRAQLTLRLCSGTGCRGQRDTVEVEFPVELRIVGPALNLACRDNNCGNQLQGNFTVSSRSIMRNE